MSLPCFLLLALLAGNVLLRFFTNSLGVLPRAFNVWDVAMTLALAALALGMPRPHAPVVDTGKILRRLLVFNGICVVGSVLNTAHVYWLAALSQLIMWNEPILLFLAIVSLPLSFGDIEKFRRLLLFLICLEVVIGLFQVPTALKPGQSEALIGTFKGNAEQYQLFLLIGVFYILGQLEAAPSGKMFRVLTILFVLGIVVIVDNKASWITLAITLAILVPKLPALRGRVSGKLRAYAFLAILFMVGYSVINLTSATARNKFGGLAEAIKSGNLLNLGKVKALRDVFSAYRLSPHMAFVGSGLGTFYSRAAFQFFPFYISDIYQNDTALGTGEFIAGSASMAGVITPVAGKKAFYKEFYQYEKIYAIGSGTADFPTSSYISLLGETGLLGTLLYLSVCFVGVRLASEHMKKVAHDSAFFPFAAASFAALIYLMLMASYNFWLDCGRVNTIVWSMLGLTTRYVMLREEESAAEQNALELAGEETAVDLARVPSSS